MFTVGALGKFKIWVHQGAYKPFLSQFCLFFEIFVFFLFFTLESCYIWFTLSLEYSSAYIYSFALVNSKFGSIWGYVNPVLSHIALFLRFFFYFFKFLLWNHVLYVMLSVYELVLAPSDLLACGLFLSQTLAFVIKFF